MSENKKHVFAILLKQGSFYSFLPCVAIIALILFVWVDSVRAQPGPDAFPPITSLKVPDYVKVVDYTGRGPVTLMKGGALTPEANKPIIIVIADELNLINEEFDYCTATAPRQVILIADTIRLKGYAKFYLSPRILGMDPQPPCSSPYLAGPNLGRTLPPVLSIVARNLVIGKEAGFCMFCPVEGSRFDTGGLTDANVESAAKPSLTIAAERVDLTGKAEILDQLLAGAFPTTEPVHTGFLYMAAMVPFLDASLEQASWAKPFFDEMAARPENAPVRAADINAIRNFWRAGLQSAPEKAHLGWWSTVRLGHRADSEGVVQPTLDVDNLAFSQGATVFGNKLADAGRNDPHAVRAVSLWAVHTFQKIYMELLEADRLEQRSEVLRLLKTFTSLPSYPVRNEHQDAYLQAVDAIKSIRDRYRNQLWRRSVQLDLINTPAQAVDLFSEGAGLDTYVAPTQALVTERMVDGRSVLGTLRYLGAGTSQDIELKFPVELTVDPLVAEAVKKTLSQGDRYAGQFSNWDLIARPVQHPGIRSSSVRISGNTLDVTLRLDGRTGTLALWQLTSDHGIPLTLDYEYRNDPAQKGKLATIPLSLARRKHSPIEVAPAGLRNRGTVPVTIDYVRLADGKLQPLAPRLVVSPGEVAAVPGMSSEQLNGLTVPAEAVSVNAPNPYSLNDFDNAQQVRLTERITITNIVPVTRLTRPGNLQRLDLRIVYKTAEGEEQETQVGLAPAGITGSQRQLTFVRLSQQGAREIWISGTAFYDNGSDTIAPQKFPAGDVVIDADTLAVNTP